MPDAPVRTLTRFALGDSSMDPHLTQEWLVTNGLGGYASGTVLGPITRRYHGLLIAALPNPSGRFMTLHGLSERFRGPAREVLYAGQQDLAGGDAPIVAPVAFHLDCGLPVWEYDLWNSRIEKRILMPHRQNTVYVQYRYLRGGHPIRLGLRPGIQFRNHDAKIDPEIDTGYTLDL